MCDGQKTVATGGGEETFSRPPPSLVRICGDAAEKEERVSEVSSFGSEMGSGAVVSFTT